MGILRRIDRRREPRNQVELSVMVWGVDTKGERFLQEARCRDISLSGGLLSGIESELRSGDVIGILYRGKKARYRVVWVRYEDNVGKIHAAIHRFEEDTCPWQELLTEPASVAEPDEVHSSRPSSENSGQ